MNFSKLISTTLSIITIFFTITSYSQTTSLNLVELEDDQTPTIIAGNLESTNQISLEDMLSADTNQAKNWQLVLDSELYSNQVDHINSKSKAKLTSAHSLYYRYLFSPTLAARASMEFEANSVPNSAERAESIKEEVVDGKTFQGTRLTDPYVAIKNTRLNFFGSSGLKIESRFYIPTSETSRFEKREGRFRFDISSAWVVGKWDLGFYINPRYVLFTNSQDTLSMREYVSATYNLNDKFSSYVYIGQRQNSSEDSFLRADSIVDYFELGTSYVVSPSWIIYGYLVNMFTQKQENISLFKAEKNEFALGTSVSF